ncbi:hypothetical protein DFS33DRAFT_1490377 [Desarmillaria ectypa]|nr:hypothetical protein DFS33DRAFT_1490377 [Desarmillaria ectypa]
MLAGHSKFMPPKFWSELKNKGMHKTVCRLAVKSIPELSGGMALDDDLCDVISSIEWLDELRLVLEPPTSSAELMKAEEQGVAFFEKILNKHKDTMEVLEVISHVDSNWCLKPANFGTVASCTRLQRLLMSVYDAGGFSDMVVNSFVILRRLSSLSGVPWRLAASSLDERAMIMDSDDLQGLIRVKEEIIQYLIMEYVPARPELYRRLVVKPGRGRLFELEDGKDPFVCTATQPRSHARLL